VRLLGWRAVGRSDGRAAAEFALDGDLEAIVAERKKGDGGN